MNIFSVRERRAVVGGHKTYDVVDESGRSYGCYNFKRERFRIDGSSKEHAETYARLLNISRNVRSGFDRMTEVLHEGEQAKRKRTIDYKHTITKNEIVGGQNVQFRRGVLRYSVARMMAWDDLLQTLTDTSILEDSQVLAKFSAMVDDLTDNYLPIAGLMLGSDEA